ncbi:hypothetical protein [Streptomyces sp. DH8]|uniref:hypothetical protein n=1 Tax=Streptomyces sp. DH8 TaxID=2857008 RepID=UPI001E63B47C|nr:hypothetical protein [Streptomyces sp. DH8]
MSVEVRGIWGRIDGWLAENAPRSEMPGPADAQSVRDLEARIGMRLPGEAGESLLVHNGSDIAQLIPPNYCLHGVAGIEKNVLQCELPLSGGRSFFAHCASGEDSDARGCEEWPHRKV